MTRAAIEDVLPLTPLQEGLLFHTQFDESGPDLYAMCFSALLSGPLNVRAFRAACVRLVARHQSLRAGFRPDRTNRTVQLVRSEVSVPWRQVDLSGYAEDEQAARLATLILAAQQDRFDLTRPPLIRFLLVRLAPDRHRFVVTNHHLVLDGWSGWLLLADLFQLYHGGGDPAGLPTPPPYRRFFEWLAAQDRAAAEAAWRTALAGLAGPTLLAPADPSRRPVIANEITVVVPAEQCARLQAVARERGLTVNTLFQGCLGAVLGAQTGRTDALFGATVSGRSPEVAGIETMVGMFINTVPVRVRWTPGEPVAAVLARLQAEQADLVAHHHLGLVDIQRAAGRSELFDTHFVFQNVPGAAGDDSSSGLRMSDIAVSGSTNYTLSVTVRTTGDTITLDIEHRPDLVDRAGAEAIAARLVRALAAVAADPDAPMGRIDLLSAAERAHALALGTGEVHEAPATPLPDLFAALVTAAGDRTALVCGAETVSFAELGRRVNRLARRLIAAGVGAEDRVAVLLPRSVDTVVALFGVLTAGGVAVPIDTGYPAERIRFLLRDTAPRLVITTGDPATEVRGSGVDQLNLAEAADRTGGSDAPVADSERREPLRPGHAAYLIHTSGSTGRPKGVVVTHGSVANLFAVHRAEVIARSVKPRSVTRAALLASFSFDASWNLLFWLLAGHELHVLSEDVRRDAAEVVRYVREHRVDMLEATPSYAAQLVETGLLATGLSVLVLGGEPVDPTLWERVRHADGVTGYNFYGPTECTVDTTICPIAAHDRPAIGRPVWNTRAYVLDESLRLVPPGAVGTLYVAGAPVARGYLGQPALTAHRFVADPYGPPGTRMYRTGDLARWTPDGHLEFHGRDDDQIKLRGYRIEPGEITTTLTTHPTVAQAATIAHDNRLIAYVVPANGSVPLDELRAHAVARLPEYLVPAVFVAIDALPLTSNGKLDRTALPEPDTRSAPTARSARTPRQEILCGMFAEILGRESVGIDEDFFEIGGHSLLATRFVARARRVFGLEVTLRGLFAAPTVAALDAVLDTAGAARPALAPAPRPEHLPLSFAQRRLWFLNRLTGPNATYNISGAIRLHGPLDINALGEAFADLATRHEALRTIFVEVDGEPEQRILDPAAGRIELAVAHPAAERLPAALRAAAAHEFDVTAADTPVRATLFPVGQDEHVLMLVVHHIAADGWSLAPLLRDLGTAYAARQTGQPPDWPPLPVQYADYTRWQRDLLGSADNPDSVLSHQLGYWSRQLAGAPECLALPVDRSRPPVASYRGDSISFHVDADLHARLACLARVNGATLFMVLHAALVALLHRLGAGTDIAIGTPLAGRTDEALDNLVGFFVNTVVLRTTITDYPSYRRLLNHIRDTDLAAYTYQDIPFEHVVEHLNPRRTLAHNPLFQVMLVVQNPKPPDDLFPGLRIEIEPIGTATAKVDLTVRVAERTKPDGTAGGLDCEIEYAVDLFDRPTVRAVVDRFLRTLAAVTADPDIPVHRIELLSAAERQDLLARHGATHPVPRLADPVAELAARTPHVPAVVCAGRALSYRELDRRANRLAHRLVAAGIGPDRLVALRMPRSVDWVVAMLAVWRAGGAYLPIDPGYPADRIRFLLADAAPALVLDSAAADPELPDTPPRVESARPGHAAYAIYTSGSTGRPKGVLVTRESVANLIAYQSQEIIAPVAGGQKRLRAALLASLSFDASWNLLCWLFAGHELHLLADEVRLDTQAVVRYVREQAVDALEATPTYGEQLVTDGLLATGLSVLILGGEPVGFALWERVRQADGVTGYNFYGPTECTVDTVVCRLADRDTPAIGRPVWNTRAYVLDPHLRPVPPGTIGIVYLAGAPVARGYLGQPALTAHRFVADPYGPPGTRMYRTGDLARWTPDGHLEFHGRDDDQIKLRGYRIEPGEITTTLTTHPTVAQAATIAHDNRLIAYVVPAGRSVDVEELRRHAAESLPEHLVPAVVVAIDALPLTSNGKLDRTALPAPAAARRPTGRAPRSPREEVLAGLFAEVLGYDSVGVEDDFFALGGHSLLATRLISRVRTVLGVELSVRTVFRTPTVAGLARELDSAGAARPALRRMVRPGVERP